MSDEIYTRIIDCGLWGLSIEAKQSCGEYIDWNYDNKTQSVSD